MTEKPRLDDVTVFLITVGASSYPACRQALEAQTVDFELVEIRDVAPMSAAFQRMLDLCRTPYYVQVDEDMILKPGAIETLARTIRGADDQTAMVYFPLWDTHLDRAILGVKAYRHDVFARFPYEDEQSCEMGQLEAVRAAGYRWAGPDPTCNSPEHPDILGYHGTKYTPAEAFDRYRDLAQKARLVGSNDWFFPWPERFLRRAMERGIDDLEGIDFRDVDVWSFFGSVAGLMNDGDGGEKDFRSPDRRLDYARLASRLVPPPSALNVYASPLCNFKCRFCRRQHDPGPAAGTYFFPPVAELVLEAFPSIRSVCIAGFGEPLTNPRCADVIQVFLGRGLYTSLITNGALVRAHANAIPWERLGYVNVSLNETNPKLHEELTGCPGAFEEVVAGIDMLVQRGANVGLSFVVHKENWQDIPSWLSFASNHRVRFVSLVNILPHHDVTDPVANEAFWRTAITDESAAYLRALDGFKGCAAQLLLDVNCWPQPISKTRNPRRCRSPFETIGVDGNYLITGCQRVSPPARHAGDAFPGLWRTSSDLVGLRLALDGATELRPECTMCFGNWRG